MEDYEGTMLIITHDRYLVNRMADRILYMEEDGLTEYIGGYDDYLEAIARRPQPSAEAASPKAEKPNSYKAQKERQSILNRAAGAVRRAEERIAAAEQELEDINQKARITGGSIGLRKIRRACKKGRRQAGRDRCPLFPVGAGPAGAG